MLIPEPRDLRESILTIDQISYALFLLFVLPQALAPNFATLVVVRGFAGAFGGTLQNGAEAIIANLFDDRKERLLAVTLYVLALVGGVTLGLHRVH